MKKGCEPKLEAELIEPLVGGVERRDAEVEDAEPPNCAMATQRFDEDRAERTNRNPLAIEFQMSLACEDHVDFGMFFVVMDLRVLLDVHDMDRGGFVLRQGKRPLGEAAGAFHRLDVIEMSENVVSHRGFH